MVQEALGIILDFIQMFCIFKHVLGLGVAYPEVAYFKSEKFCFKSPQRNTD
jgi:hypothetical protein